MYAVYEISCFTCLYAPVLLSMNSKQIFNSHVIRLFVTEPANSNRSMENCTWGRPLKDRYHYKYVDGNVLLSFDLDGCKAMCLEVDTCHSINYHAATKKCRLHQGNTTYIKPEYATAWELYNLYCGFGRSLKTLRHIHNNQLF